MFDSLCLSVGYLGYGKVTRKSANLIIQFLPESYRKSANDFLYSLLEHKDFFFDSSTGEVTCGNLRVQGSSIVDLLSLSLSTKGTKAKGKIILGKHVFFDYVNAKGLLGYVKNPDILRQFSAPPKDSPAASELAEKLVNIDDQDEWWFLGP